MRSTALLGFVFAAAVGLSGCDVQTGEGHGFSMELAAGKATDTWTRTYKLPEGGRIELVNVNGRIDAEPASGDSVELIGERTVKDASDEAAKAFLEQLEMKEEVGGSKVRVEARTPRSNHRPFGLFRGDRSVEIKWTVRVPKGVEVDFKTVNGGVHMNDLKSPEVHAQTTNGGVIGKRLQASRVEASAVNGGIEIELASALPSDGHVELETVNGGVRLDLPASSKATISARAVNGGVRVTDLDVVQQGEPNRRRLDGVLNGGGARVSLETTNGGVRLSRSASPSS